MSDIRDKAGKILAQVPGEVRSNGDRPLFQKLTGGVTHEVLMENWKQGGIRTVCIDFVCWYAAQMGIDIISSIPPKLRNSKVDGFFALRETLAKCGKGYAYVAATKDGPEPQCGDILRHGAFHVDVALGFDGILKKGSAARVRFLRRAAGGQSSHPRPKDESGKLIKPPPNVSAEYDNVMRVPRPGQENPYDPSNLQGWLDIEKFFGPPPGSMPEAPNAGKTGSLWFNESGDVVHPDAPVGGGGPGFFRGVPPMCASRYDYFLPHPHSRVARTLDPLRIQQRQQEEWRNKRDADQFG